MITLAIRSGQGEVSTHSPNYSNHFLIGALKVNFLLLSYTL